MKLDYKTSPEQWKMRMRTVQGTMFGATGAAFRDLARQVQREGRAEIVRGGLGPRFARGFRTWIFPRQPDFTTDLSMRGQHRLNFANVFERGGRIAGKPLLWVPLPSAPKRIDGERTTARLYVLKIGPLHSINRPGRPPLLAGYAMRGNTGRAFTPGQLRTGQRNARRNQARAAFGGRRGKRPVSVPLFVGLRAAQIRDRLNVSAVYDRGRADLPRFYFKHLARFMANVNR